MPKRVIQIISFGHPIGATCQKHLKQKFPETEFKTFYRNIHLARYDQVQETVKAAFEDLRLQPLDLSGGTPTWLVLPAAGVASAAVQATWLGLTGQLPAVLNLIRRGQDGSEYVPSPELPVIFLETIKKQARESRQQLVAPQGVVVF